MGTPKAVLDFRGQPFVIRILEALEALDLKPRVVVLGPDAPRIRPTLAAHECLIVENPEAAGGPIGSLRAPLAALKPVRPGGLLAWPLDLPQARVPTIARLPETSPPRPAPPPPPPPPPPPR